MIWRWIWPEPLAPSENYFKIAALDNTLSPKAPTVGESNLKMFIDQM